jgi:hypothetical protein
MGLTVVNSPDETGVTREFLHYREIATTGFP